MKLLVGLGNPGSEYQMTRHNAGFMFVGYVGIQLKTVWRDRPKFLAKIAETENLWLVEPTTFMNESGQAVSKIMRFYKLAPQDLILVHDDLDLKLGSWKLQLGVGPKVHNGVLSVEEHLGSKDFWRLRLGVDNRTPEQRAQVKGDDYVLSKFQESERQILESRFSDAWEQVSKMLD